MNSSHQVKLDIVYSMKLDFFLALFNSIAGLIFCAVLSEHAALSPPVALVPYDRPIHQFGSFEHEQRSLMIGVLSECYVQVVVTIGDDSLPACEVCSPKTKTAMAAIIKYKFRSLASCIPCQIPDY